jgi:hypothetical protein
MAASSKARFDGFVVAAASGALIDGENGWTPPKTAHAPWPTES